MIVLSFIQNEEEENNYGIKIISGIILIILPGIRSRFVGTDTNNYVSFYNYLTDYTKPFLSIETNIEKGFLLLEKLAIQFSSDYSSLLFFIAIFSVVPTIYAIHVLSYNFRTSVFIYFSLASYLFFFNGARQAIAASIFSISVIFLLKRELFKYVAVIIIASFFHRTVLIMLPFYFILNFEFSIKRIILFSVLSFIAITFLSFFISFFDEGVSERYGEYINRGAEGGYLLGLFYIVCSFVLIFFRKFITEEDIATYDIYLNLCIFSSLVYLVVITTGVDVNFIRFTLFFTMGYILIWPIILKNHPSSNQLIFKISFYSIHILFLYIYLQKMSDLIPYEVNPMFELL
jgi:hypothetical protein